MDFFFRCFSWCNCSPYNTNSIDFIFLHASYFRRLRTISSSPVAVFFFFHEMDQRARFATSLHSPARQPAHNHFQLHLAYTILAHQSDMEDVLDQCAFSQPHLPFTSSSTTSSPSSVFFMITLIVICHRLFGLALVIHVGSCLLYTSPSPRDS